ncbi:hypothetical protein KK083_09640 [Fulvivirgaceae bacterium PWU4]|uniref:Uncharacterized protein n=1 Tax=Chryseosolibacter histidini TaxID=2782349 RepID=A0AAP2DLI5_9BACT|nr:hypothetical protein [Chryseosolibacter histidini]MBT1697137.1 hypothetical protein [Chryseosolibacter histidini]
MKFLRNRFVSRTISVFLLLIFVQSLILPSGAIAFTGPHQPEYVSYEAPGSTDMVNLLTGDFSFSLPVLEVPGPEGNFSLPLSYNAGIGLEQEASWVGLGWSMNAGAITRSINEFPDDASGEYQMVNVQDLTGLRGWNARNLLLGNMGWNNQKGHYGALSLLSIVNADWNENSSSVGVIGLNVASKGFEVDPVQFASGVATILSWGAVGAAAGSASAARTAVAKQIMVDAVSNVAFSGVASLANGNSPNAPAAGYWQYSKTEKKNWGLKILTGFMDNVNEYKIWLDQTRVEDMYGTLYLGNAQADTFTKNLFNLSVGVGKDGTEETIMAFRKTASGGSGTLFNQGAASDINYGEKNYVNFRESNTPAILATDNFSVKAPGLSGSIAPYRLEVGSVSLPREMTKYHDRLAPVQYLLNDGTETSYKVPFKYRGQVSSKYYHHSGDATNVTSPGFNWGLGWTIVDKGANSPRRLRYDLNDVVLKNQRIASSVNAARKIPAARHIEWLSNGEIAASTTYSSGFLDFLTGQDRVNFRTGTKTSYALVKSSNFSHVVSNVPSNFITSNSIGNGSLLDFTISFYASEEDMSNGITSSIVELQEVPVTGATATSIQTDPSGPLSGFSGYADIEIRPSTTSIPDGVSGTAIGGFSITREDGTTYHFALPVYDSDSYLEVRDVSDANKKSIIKRPGAFANTWLLTAVTGPDFIDRDQNGMVNDNDWGHWVKLHYGMHSDAYNWRIPYDGYRRDALGKSQSYQRGRSQLIYLNSIETRSHMALFKKSVRADGRSIKVKASESFVSPLKLDEIILLSKEGYKKLTSSLGMQDHTNRIDRMFTVSSITASMQDFINKNAEKRIQFSYNYNLCKGVPNTNNGSPNNGRLTLNRISIVGRNNVKIVPDYIFSYDQNNPNYNMSSWDGFGMYTTNTTTHKPDQNDASAKAWSLAEITTPLGSKIRVNYETDDYSSISGMSVGDSYFFNNTPGPGGNTSNPQLIIVPHEGTIQAGDQIDMTGFATWMCNGDDITIFNKAFSGTYTVSNVDDDHVLITEDFLEIDRGNCAQITFFEFSGSIKKNRIAKKGGGIRVGSIVAQDEFGQSNKKIRYLYNTPEGHSSGVISQEPAFVGGSFTSSIGYPVTPVVYGSVSVLTGRLSDDMDFHTRQVYEFETPKTEHYVQDEGTPIALKLLIDENAFLVPELNNAIIETKDYLSAFQNKISDRTSKIGTLKSIKIFDHVGTEISSSSLSYTHEISNNGIQGYQGTYTGGTIMVDRIPVDFQTYHKINRTTVIEYPWVLEKIVNSKDGLQTEMKNLSWDPLTGSVDQVLSKSSLGVYVKKVTIPAYRIYGEMGSKAEGQGKKNMLSQTAAIYNYRTDALGIPTGLISAEIQTWKKDWTNYRYYNQGLYVENPQQPESAANPVWRKGPAYVWKGKYSKLNVSATLNKPKDGTQTFSPSDQFDFSAGPTDLWQYTGEALRFDHFGMPVETKDLNGIRSAVKTGYGERTVIASATNAGYHEIAFSSAEDLFYPTPNNPYFGGEVALENGTVKYLSKGQTSSTHTGDAVVAVSSGHSFVFRTSGLAAQSNYKSSVWTNNTNGRIYYKINGGGEIVPSNQTISAVVNGWYRVDVVLPKQSSDYSLEIGVKSANGSEVYFDDFRFQPVKSIMTCYVYPPLDFEFTNSSATFSSFNYVLNNENVFIKFEHNERGVLVRTYSESIMYGVKLISESKDNYRRSTLLD